MTTSIFLSELNTLRETELVLKCGAYIRLGCYFISNMDEIPKIYKYSLDIVNNDKYDDILKQPHKDIVKLIEEFYKRTQQ